MLYNPLQHTRMGESGNNDKEYTDDDHRGTAESREGLLGIKDASDKENGYSPQEHKVGPQLGEQQYGKHRQYGDYRYPGMKGKS